MTWKTKIHELANSDCEACGGEGICCYAMGEDGYDDVCDVCFPHGMPDFEADEYDQWGDNQMDFEDKK